MAGSTSITRRADLQRARRKVKPGDMLSLEMLAVIWGTAKGTFVNTRHHMENFPSPVKGEGNSHNYDAVAALESMIQYERRGEVQARLKQSRTDAIMGRDGKSRRDEADALHTPNELSTLNRTMTEIEQRERDQREYIPVAEVAAIAADVFGFVSEFFGGLSNQMDPSGQLPPEVRDAIDQGGKDALLRLHRMMKDMLSPDGNSNDPKRAGARSQNGRARSARARR